MNHYFDFLSSLWVSSFSSNRRAAGTDNVPAKVSNKLFELKERKERMEGPENVKRVKKFVEEGEAVETSYPKKHDSPQQDNSAKKKQKSITRFLMKPSPNSSKADLRKFFNSQDEGILCLY
jgi:hypothetical protein